MAKTAKDLIARSEVAAAPADPLSGFTKLLERKDSELGRLGINPQRFIRIVLTHIRTNQALVTACLKNKAGMLGACMQLAQWNLDPSVPNECWLIPYGNVINPQLGYKGLKKLAERAALELNNPFKVLAADAIYSNDEFDCEKGDRPFLKHKPPLKNRGELVAFYAVARDSNDRVCIETPMSVEDMQKHKKRFSKAKGGPLADPDNFERYGVKTMLRLLCTRQLDMTPVLAEAIASDIASEAGAPSVVDIIDVTPEPVVEVEAVAVETATA